jgi:FkbM family methyltransferase
MTIDRGPLAPKMAWSTLGGFGNIMSPYHRATRPENPWWEAARIAAMRHFLQPGMLMMDVGTEEGDMSALFASWGVDLFLIEPNPKAWPWIKATFEANGLEHRVIGWLRALVSDEETPPVYADDAKDVGWIGQPVEWPSFADDPDRTPEHGFLDLVNAPKGTVVRTIDDLAHHIFLGQHRRIDAITMDIEGGELHALRGARQTLEGDRPMVFLSVHPRFMAELYDQHPDELFSYMIGLGYRGQFLAADHEHHFVWLPDEHPHWQKASPFNPDDWKDIA